MYRDEDPDITKQPICDKCNRRRYPAGFHSPEWNKKHPGSEYCRAGKYMGFEDWGLPSCAELNCYGKEIGGLIFSTSKSIDISPNQLKFPFMYT